MQEARRQGVPPHRVVPWVRKKLGGGLLVVRFRTDGSPACAAPCILCSKEIKRFDLKVVCVDEGGGWFCGRLSDPGAPSQRLTTGQKNAQFGKWEVARAWPPRRKTSDVELDGKKGGGRRGGGGASSEDDEEEVAAAQQRGERERGGREQRGGGTADCRSERARARPPALPPQLPPQLRCRQPVPLTAG